MQRLEYSFEKDKKTLERLTETSSRMRRRIMRLRLSDL